MTVYQNYCMSTHLEFRNTCGSWGTGESSFIEMLDFYFCPDTADFQTFTIMGREHKLIARETTQLNIFFQSLLALCNS